MEIDKIKQLIKEMPDKHEAHGTTSHKFKEFLVDKFYPKRNTNVLEVGCHKGQTTLVLSKLFNKVYAMNINTPDDNWHCYNEPNVIHEHMDSYKDPWKYDKWENIEVILIDCVHEYSAVIQDTANALKFKPRYLIYDDYGIKQYRESVGAAIDDMCNTLTKQGKLKDFTKFGLEEGEKISDNKGHTFIDSEGAIIELQW